jgi:site-specific DNA recombinase
LKQINGQIPEIQGEIDFLKIQFLSSDQIFNEAKDLYSRWRQLTFEEKRRIIENITEKIHVDKEEVTINLTYLPSSLEMMAKEQRNLRGSWRQRA